jgi:hypothetical protein
MDALAFESWVSEHYEELVQIAYRTTRRKQNAAVDLLHDLVEAICESGKFPSAPDLMAWFGMALRRDSLDMRDAEQRAALRIERLEASLTALGPQDTYSHTRDKELAANARRTRAYRARKNGHVTTDSAPMHLQVEFVGRPEGDTRWRYQQLRDGRLFDERAVRSIAESMHKASRRIRHDGEAGFSFTEFGAENGPVRSTQENAR